MITIWNFARGARGVRVAWLCEEMGLPYTMQLIGYPVPAEYRARNPLGTVPFLEDGDAAITESTAMLLHLAAKYGPSPLLPPPDSSAYARVLQMTVLSEATLGASLNALLMDRFAVAKAEQGGALAKMVRGRVEEVLGYVEQVLAAGPYLAGDVFTVADIAICTSLSLWRGPAQGALSKALTDYHARATSRPAYERAVKANAAS